MSARPEHLRHPIEHLKGFEADARSQSMVRPGILGEAQSGDIVITDIEDVSAMALSTTQLADLVGEGGLCVFNWTTSEGYPVGVLVAYVFHNGRFWTTAPTRRKRVSALRARPASSIVVTSNASAATFKGDSIIHSPSDPGWDLLKGWFYAAMSGTARDPDDIGAQTMRELLDSPHRVIIETPAHPVVSFDWAKFERALSAATRQRPHPRVRQPPGGSPGAGDLEPQHA
jgi:hypothetical protein